MSLWQVYIEHSSFILPSNCLGDLWNVLMRYTHWYQCMYLIKWYVIEIYTLIPVLIRISSTFQSSAISYLCNGISFWSEVWKCYIYLYMYICVCVCVCVFVCMCVLIHMQVIICQYFKHKTHLSVFLVLWWLHVLADNLHVCT